MKFCFCMYFTNEPFRLFCNSVGFRFEKSIQVLKESSLEFWCNVTLNNCMYVKKQTTALALVTASEVLLLVWNETPPTDLSILSSSISTVKDCHAESTIFMHFHQVACSKLAGRLQPSLNKSSIRLTDYHPSARSKFDKNKSPWQ